MYKSILIYLEVTKLNIHGTQNTDSRAFEACPKILTRLVKKMHICNRLVYIFEHLPSSIVSSLFVLNLIKLGEA